MHTYRGIAQLREASSLEPPERWLSPAEWSHYDANRERISLQAWLCGRWCAKQVVRKVPDCRQVPLREIHIESRDGLEQRVAPRVFVRGRLRPWKLSLSHGQQLCSAILSVEDNLRVGTDVVNLAGSARGLERYWFTEREQERCGSSLTSMLMWGLKEAIYKALGDGGRFFPKEIDTTSWIGTEELLQLAEGQLEATNTCALERGAELSWRLHDDEMAMYFVVPTNVDAENNFEFEQQKVVLQ